MGRATHHDGTKLERRKSKRFPVAIPMEVTWEDDEGNLEAQYALAKEVNSQGGALEMAFYPGLGSRIRVQNLLSAQVADARVLGTPSTRQGVSHGIAIELVTPNGDIWGSNLQIATTSVELVKLEQFLSSEDIDPRLLQEYRSTSVYLQLITHVWQQLRARKVKGDEVNEERAIFHALIERTTAVCSELVSDLKHYPLSEPDELAELHGVLAEASDVLWRILHPGKEVTVQLVESSRRPNSDKRLARIQ